MDKGKSLKSGGKPTCLCSRPVFPFACIGSHASPTAHKQSQPLRFYYRNYISVGISSSSQEMSDPQGDSYPCFSPFYPHQTVPNPCVRDESASGIVNESTMSRGTFNLEFPHRPFAIIYVDENGQLRTKASASIADHAWAIFTPDVTAQFRERAFRHGQPNMTIPGMTYSSTFIPPRFRGLAYLKPPDNVFSSFDVSPTAGWRCPSSSMPTKLIPFEWEACRPSRKRMDTRRVGVGESQTRSALPVPSTAAEGMLCIKDREILMEYYKKAFEVFQQTNCRLIAKSYIRFIEPRKQVNFPYNGRAKMARSSQRADPELTKPGWWPAGVPHRGPDHLLKERMLSPVSCSLPHTYSTRPFALAVAYPVRAEGQPRHHCRKAPRGQSS